MMANLHVSVSQLDIAGPVLVRSKSNRFHSVGGHLKLYFMQLQSTT